MAAAVKVYVQETFADIEDEFCDADSVVDMEEVVEERTIQVDVNNQIYHDFNEVVEVDEVEYEFVQDDAFKVIVQEVPVQPMAEVMVEEVPDPKWIEDKEVPDPPMPNVYKCDVCDYKSTRKSNLVRHIKSSHDLDRIECEHCGNNFIDLCSLKRHIKTAHESVMYKCSHCEFKSTRADTLKEHTNVVHFNVRFICEECNHQATSKRALRRHTKAKHLSTLKNVDPGKVSDHDQLKNRRIKKTLPVDEDDPDELIEDDQWQGENRLVLIGDSKDDNCEVKVTYEGQDFTFSSVESADGDSVLYGCSQCNYANKWKNKLSEHIKSVHKGVKFACSEEGCNFTSASKFNLKRHIASVHEGVTYSCPYAGCSYKISQAPHLKAHIKAKHKNQKFKCDQCAFECCTPHGLTQHKKAEHLGIRYKCHLCKYQATQMSNLRTHIKKIHAEKKDKSACNQGSLLQGVIVEEL